MHATKTDGTLAVQRRTLCCGILFLSLVGAARFAPAAPPSDVIAEFDIRPSGDVVTIPVIIKGRAYPFAIDTGASNWIVDESLRPVLDGGIDGRKVRTANGDVTAARYAGMPPVQIGPFTTRPRSGAVCARFHDDLASFGQDFYGFICAEFLRDKIFRIDFDRGKFQFLRRVGNDAGERFKLTWRNGVPHIGLLVRDLREEEFLIDTGNCGFDTGGLRKELFDALVTTGRLKPLSGRELQSYSPVAGLDGFATVALARLDRLTLGPFRHEDLLFTRSSVSMVGLGYLSRYLVTFDLERSEMYLKPGRSFAKRDRYALGGIGLARVGGKTIVDGIEEGGPAAAAGLRESDEIVEVDGLAAARTSVFELCRVFATPGAHRVRLRRGPDDRTDREVMVVLKEPEEQGKP